MTNHTTINKRNEKMKKENWKKIGVVGVDSGQLVICDPCYINCYKGKQKELNNYQTLIKKHENKIFAQLNYDLGHKGLGVVFGGFGGDGTYNVYAKIRNEGHTTESIEAIVLDFCEPYKPQKYDLNIMEAQLRNLEFNLKKLKKIIKKEIGNMTNRTIMNRNITEGK